MTFRMLEKLITAGLLAFSMTAGAEDIDLFMNPTPADVDKPNVLIIVDNTANWQTAFSNEMRALDEMFRELPPDAFRIGIMFASETGSPNSNLSGGYVRAALRLMTGTNKTTYANLITSLDWQADKGNGGESSLVMAEAYRYLTGGVPYAGTRKVKTDYTGNSGVSTASDAVYALPGNALESFNGLRYNKPTSTCQKSFIIYLSNGDSRDNSDVLAKSLAMLQEADGSATKIPLSPSTAEDNLMDEWARFLKASPLNVTTFTIDVDKKTSGQGPGWTALLKSMAAVSEGAYFDVSSAGTGQGIKDALNNILANIQAENSVFAAVSLPVSVNTQGTYLNQVFIGMFRPEQGARPRWAGNMKHYKLGYTSTGTLGLLDAAGKDAISSTGTGFLDVCSRSYWTPTAVDSYWEFKPQGSCLAVAGSNNSNSPDGDVVEKGAQAYKLRSTTTRTVKTCSTIFSSCSSALTTLPDFDNSIQPAALGAASTSERDDLVNWAKGLDVAVPSPNLNRVDGDENGNKVVLTEMRPSAHADVVHARPVAINFGTDSAPNVVLFYGTNDGLLHAVNGNRDGGSAGMELWSFMAPEFYPHIKRIRDNKIAIKFPGLPTSLDPVPEPKRYGFDGPIGVYNEGGNVWIYPTMRRGGRVVYSFDVSSPGTPKLKWKKGCPNLGNDIDCSEGFSALGQTWSTPKVMKTTGYTSPMLIMGGGYDSCEDSDPATCGSTKGNRVYVMDANTGLPLRTFETDRAVAADVFVIPDATTGMAKYAYAVDLGGNVYRISGAEEFSPFGGTHPKEWKIKKIASLGCGTPGTCSPNRKFMFMPDVVDEGGTYALMLGSGDREKPLNDYTYATSVENYFFMLKDRPSDSGWLELESERCGDDVICLNSLYLRQPGSSTPTPATLAEYKGWALPMTAKEQVVTSAITVFGTLTFSSHTPAVYDATACTSGLGKACVYNLNYTNADNVNGTANICEAINGGGLPPSPVAGMVTLDGQDTNGDGVADTPGETVPFIIGANPKSALEGGTPTPPATAFQPKTRVYWNIQP